MSTRQAQQPPHVPIMDGLRAIAIALVVASNSILTGFHPELAIGNVRIGSDWFVYGGSLGVELFFFISGFVLFLPYTRAKLENEPMPSLRHFADRRFIKIVPSYYLALFVQAALFTLGSDVEGDRVHQILSHAFFLHAFDPRTFTGIDAAFWTLAPEIQFYILFPLVAYAMVRRPGTTFAAIFAGGIGYRQWLHVADRAGDFFWVSQLPGQIDIFALGMLSAFGYAVFATKSARESMKTGATVIALLATAAGVSLLANFAAASSSSAGQQLWQNDHRIVLEFTIAALVLGSLFAARWWQRLLSLPPLLWLSGISYNLYLWHEAVLTQCSHTGFPCAGRLQPWLSIQGWNEQFLLGYIVISLTIAWIITEALEKPLLRLGTRGAYLAFVAPAVDRIRNPMKKPAKAS